MKKNAIMFALAVSQAFCSANDDSEDPAHHGASGLVNAGSSRHHCSIDRADLESKFFVLIRNTLLDKYPGVFRYMNYEECPGFFKHIPFRKGNEGNLKLFLNQSLGGATARITNIPIFRENKKYNYEAMNKVKAMLLYVLGEGLTAINFDTYANSVQVSVVNPQNIPATLMGNVGFLYATQQSRLKEGVCISSLATLRAFCRVVAEHYPHEVSGISGVLPTEPLGVSIAGLDNDSAEAVGGIIESESPFFQAVARQFPSHPYPSGNFVQGEKFRSFRGVNFRTNDHSAVNPLFNLFLGQLPFIYTSEGTQNRNHLENMKRILSVISCVFPEGTINFVRFNSNMRNTCHVIFKTREAAELSITLNQRVLFGRDRYISVGPDQREAFKGVCAATSLDSEAFSSHPMVLEPPHPKA